MKRLISLGLICAMVFGFAPMALADDDEDNVATGVAVLSAEIATEAIHDANVSSKLAQGLSWEAVGAGAAVKIIINPEDSYTLQLPKKALEADDLCPPVKGIAALVAIPFGILLDAIPFIPSPSK